MNEVREHEMPTSVIVVDDHEIVREGLRALVSTDPELVSAGEAATAAEARVLLRDAQPDVAVLDIVLPDGDGIQLCREARGLSPRTTCVLLTTFPEGRAKLAAALAGAAAYLPKEASGDAIRRTICEAAAGRTISREEIRATLDSMLESSCTDHAELARLTPQERRAFELVGQGLSNLEIADQMGLSEKTVKNYVSRVLRKLDMNRRTEAAVLAARLSERHAQQDAREATHLVD